MRTTIDESVDRRGDANPMERLEGILFDARRLLADISALLELNIEKLESEKPLDDQGQAELAKLRTALGEVHKTMRMVLDFEGKLCIASLDAPPIDLEAARAEILSRFDPYLV